MQRTTAIYMALASVVALLAASVAWADDGWERIRPSQVQRYADQRHDALAAMLTRRAKPLWSETLDDRPDGRLGQGVHGEWVIPGRALLGYSGRSKPGDDLHAKIESGTLHLVDRRRDGSIYVRMPAGEAAGRFICDITSPRGEPITITLDAYQAALVVPGEQDWRKWFGDQPRAAHFVYLAGTGSGYAPGKDRRDNYRPIDTGVSLEPARHHRVEIEWDHSLNRVNVRIDGRHVIRDERFLSDLGQKTDFVTIRPGSFQNDGRYDNGELMIDNATVSALVWPARSTSP